MNTRNHELTRLLASHTGAQAAKLLGTTQRTIWRYLSGGTIPEPVLRLARLVARDERAAEKSLEPYKMYPDDE